MPEVHQFTYGAVNPVAAFVMAFLGAMLGLTATTRARDAERRGRRIRWLAIASVAIGGGIWMMHFVAMLGFDVPASPVRYDLPVTMASALPAVVALGPGLFLTCTARSCSIIKVLVGGLFGGAGIAAMHYVGMAALRLDGTIGYSEAYVVASVLVGTVASIVALGCAATVRDRLPTVLGAATVALALVGMHYIGIAALRVHLNENPGTVGGTNPILLVVPICVVATIALVTLVLSALQAMTQEDFALTANLSPPVVSTPEPRPDEPRAISLGALRPTASIPRHNGHNGVTHGNVVARLPRQR
jgi:NO-binding membrane sensor protein with MHYT domain